jgi:3',5'-cyclic AMP phosphodiesterase CpdA
MLRVVHLADIHVQPERGATEGFAACLRHVHHLSPAPDLILNGGDAIMDGVSADKERAEEQWELFTQTLSAENHEIPVRHCIGNHDIWGWNRRRSGCTGSEPLFGKRLALERLGMASPYYTFDWGGWMFVVLDSSFDSFSTQEAAFPQNFTARLDATQWTWLETTLSQIPPEMPIVIVSHCPILGGGSLFFSGGVGETERSGDWVVPSSWMHIDARAIVGLLLRFSNIKLCLSGHTHIAERVDFQGISFINSGAVSGRWWRNTDLDPAPTYAPPGYSVLDLYPNGSFHHTRLTFPL